MTCNAFPTVFAQPMCALGWDVRKERTCCLLSIAKGLVTYWAFQRLPVEQRLVCVQVLGNPLARYCRHGFIRTVECKMQSFPSPNTNLQPLRTQLTSRRLQAGPVPKEMASPKSSCLGICPIFVCLVSFQVVCLPVLVLMLRKILVASCAKVHSFRSAVFALYLRHVLLTLARRLRHFCLHLY
jgi:hypothetical protein